VTPPYPVIRNQLDRALAGHDLATVRRVAREHPQAVTLADAVRVLLLMLDADDPKFEAAAVRWIARFTSECRGASLGEVRAALEALEALAAPDATATLSALLRRHGVGGNAGA
jgi:hypothetical protein